ncbi:hypothetical protein [Aquincola sp. J276]|uniref:hypothetical protein n=1 Tax=Aquincola sp. J276 TaxID=2898432 RepID=UPI002150A907|nr:hypothetical protein [Aquincola sp. J276]MCR5868502.1 hypothetical protein [Aquincola sp. J276]
MPLLTHLPAIFKDAFGQEVMRSCVIEALDWTPELKHEGLICTFLSASLRRRGIQATREVTVNRRRYDINVNGQNVEAKYHVEGDLHEVISSFAQDSKFRYDKRGWNSASKAIHDEINRDEPTWFLWLIAVRDYRAIQPFIYLRLIKKFYEKSGASSWSQAVVTASCLLDNEVLSAFQSRLNATVHKLPVIRGEHTALVSRLYRLTR